MSIVKWNPLRELETMRRDMERLFEEFFEPSPRRRWRWLSKAEAETVSPSIDVYDKKNEIVIKAELPGVEKENIDLTISENSLIIKAESKKDEEIKEEDYYSREIHYGTYSRTITLPAEVDSSKAKATLKNGILEIVLPKKEEAKPKEIKVEVA